MPCVLFQPLANLLGLTKSEVSELLTALGKDNRSQHHTAEVSGNSTRSPVSLCIAAFLGCFEFASGINRRKKEEETSPDNSAGPSGVGSVIPVAVRKGLSSQMTVQLGEFITIRIRPPTIGGRDFKTPAGPTLKVFE